MNAERDYPSGYNARHYVIGETNELTSGGVIEIALDGRAWELARVEFSRGLRRCVALVQGGGSSANPIGDCPDGAGH